MESTSFDHFWSLQILKILLLLVMESTCLSLGNSCWVHFLSHSGFNEFSIEMFINVLQCNVLLSEAEAKRCKWAATVNWKEH